MRFNKKSVISLLIVLVLIIAFIFWTIARVSRVPQKIAVPTQPATLVTAALVKRAPLLHTFSFVGTLKAAQAVNVTTEVEGTIAAIHFQSGQVVQKNQLLLSLRHHKQAAAVEKTQSAYDAAKDLYERSKKLYVKQIISALDMTKLKYTLSEAEADLLTAKTAYQQCFIRAPFAGKLGIRQVSVGQYLQPGDVIVNLQSRPAKYVDFSIPEFVGKLLTPAVHMTVQADQQRNKIYQATIVAVDSDVDTSTRTLNLRAVIAHPAETLLPGAFATIRMKMPATQKALLVPNTAVDYAPYGASVYVIEQGKAKLRYIQTRGLYGEFVIVSSGLTRGEQVITAGQDKLQDGAPVQVAAEVKQG